MGVGGGVVNMNALGERERGVILRQIFLTRGKKLFSAPMLVVPSPETINYLILPPPHKHTDKYNNRYNIHSPSLRGIKYRFNKLLLIFLQLVEQVAISVFARMIRIRI